MTDTPKPENTQDETKSSPESSLPETPMASQADSKDNTVTAPEQPSSTNPSSDKPSDAPVVNPSGKPSQGNAPMTFDHKTQIQMFNKLIAMVEQSQQPKYLKYLERLYNLRFIMKLLDGSVVDTSETVYYRMLNFVNVENTLTALMNAYAPEATDENIHEFNEELNALNKFVQSIVSLADDSVKVNQLNI